MQADGHVHRLAGGTDAVEPAGLGPVAGPGVQAAGVELAVGRAEPAPHDAGRRRRDRQRAHPALHPAADDFVRHHEDLAVAIREVQERPSQRRPGRMAALDPHQLGRRSVEGIGDPADRRLHRRVRCIRDIVITPHVPVEPAPLDPVDPVLGDPEPLLVGEEEGAVGVEAHAVGGAEPGRQDLGRPAALARSSAGSRAAGRPLSGRAAPPWRNRGYPRRRPAGPSRTRGSAR